MSVDLNKAGMLLHIASKARDWPNLRGLHDVVMVELEDMARQAGKELADSRAEVKAKAEAEANAKIAAQIEAEAKSKANAEAATQKEIDDAKVAEERKKAEFAAAEEVRKAEVKEKMVEPPLPLGGEDATSADAVRRL